MRVHRFLAAAASLVAVPSLVGCGGSSSDQPLELSDVVFAGDRFVAVGAKGRAPGPSGVAPAKGVIITSPDGTAWRQVEVDVDLPLWSVAQGNGRFVAVGGTARPTGTERRGVVMVSDDGHAWQRADPDPDVALAGVAHGNGRFVAVTFDDRVFTSADGHDWALAGMNMVFKPDLHHIAFGNGVFVSFSSPSEIAVSTDGVAWIPAELDGDLVVSSVSFAGGAFFAGLGTVCGAACGNPYPVARSTDGAAWSTLTEDLGYQLADVAHQDGTFVGATPAALLRSPDGVAWAPGSGVEDRSWAAAAAGSSGFVAVGRGFVAHSAKGSAWTEIAVDVE